MTTWQFKPDKRPEETCDLLSQKIYNNVKYKWSILPIYKNYTSLCLELALLLHSLHLYRHPQGRSVNKHLKTKSISLIIKTEQREQIHINKNVSQKSKQA